ncbi:hypothetical protein CHS0354_029682 [Potamilus streckersoni]|uniref:Laccase n=1 Tax=Potamilus streckersoni TaxID=2493646 RepID=A0AAE0RTS7_9BIVA|nr:hypothetical protein CHS0354_029682 [Potamilus streckersoni]
MASWLFIIGFVITMETITVCNVCTIKDNECEFYLNVDHRLTMMRNGELLYAKAGNLYKYDVNDTSKAKPINMEDVITADGWEKPRLVGAVNGKMPGPPIIVYEGQMVIVHVTNNLINEGLTIHWHGLFQNGTPWMDGVPFVTQCPILPGQTFTYKFKAEPRGTHWYHSHVGTQRTMGIFGALIIRERKYHKEDEHIMTIIDYNHDMDSLLSYMKDVHGLYQGRTPAIPSEAIDGTAFDLFHFHSGLINGRGRFNEPETGNNNGAPLEVFRVMQGKSYRFRVIAAGSMLAFRISVDQHQLMLVASDGHDLENMEVESFIINPGESFDFILVTNRTVSNYWIRAETLEIDKNHRTEAILRYQGAPIVEPTTSRKRCSASSRCIVANCPYLLYPPSHYTDCLTFNDLRGAPWNEPPPRGDELHFEEHFLNFGIPGEYPASVNGIVFKTPTVSALTQRTDEIFHCSKPSCGEERVCTCTHSIDITYGNVVQLVFTNMGLGKGQPHPIHLHGHAFYVMKMGYGKYDNITAKNIGENLDVNCRGNINRDESYCNKATWSDLSWLQGNVPGLKFERPPLKDTLIIPSGGYAVVRFRADNPGLWLMHCHMEVHHIEGMRLLLNESLSMVPKPPNGFPVCGNFLYGTNTQETKAFEYDKGVYRSPAGEKARIFETIFVLCFEIFIIAFLSHFYYT